MGFRDDRIAAHARAEALARRLVERERELAALRAALDEAERRASAAQQADDERHRADEARDAARAKLEAAAGRAAAPPPASPRARADTADLEERERARRIDRSLSLLGSMSWEVTLFVAVAVIGFFTVAIHSTYGQLLAAVFFAAGAGPVIALKLLAPRWCQYLYRREQSWARARGIDGYPELLVTTPDEHQHIVVRLEFGDEIPAALNAVMRSEGLEPTADGRFRGLRPVTRWRSRGLGGLEDHNRAARRWVHRLDRTVLAPLRVAHDVRSTVLTIE